MNKRRRQYSRSEPDSAWKDVLTDFFPEFIQFFFPDIYAEIDWTRGYQFLDKELAKIARGYKTGKRLADKLVQVYLNDGTETWLLIHIEVQGRLERDFDQRMFVYNYRLGDIFKRAVVSLAVLTGASGTSAEVGRYETGRWRCRTIFEFPVIRITDYAARWAELEASDNAFAVVIMAQLKANEARGDNARKFEWKRRLIFMLYERGYSRERIHNLFKFIDWVLILSDELEEVLGDEIIEIEEGKRMPYITSMERMGHKRGVQEGVQSLVLRLLAHRFGALEAETQARVTDLSLEEKEALGEALLDFTSQEELTKWLDACASKN